MNATLQETLLDLFNQYGYSYDELIGLHGTTFTPARRVGNEAFVCPDTDRNKYSIAR